ncbi:MAG: hypothetical protein JWQ71_607, partial [Pedosphaera sp.]|nr:hypothetical protein [Pedosphaera sp.]
ASRAAKEAASKRDFTAYKQAQAAKSGSSGNPSDAPQSRTLDPSGNAPPIIPRSTSPTVNSQPTSYGGNNYSGSYRQTYYPDYQTYSTRSVRIRNYYTPYYSRPVVIYNDNYSSLFWWWLLDRPLEERARWTYYHRNDMDDARYRALVYQDMELDNRVRELEQRQAPIDPDYVPAGMDRDLMYTDKYINRVYHNRPTHNGQIAFWFIIIPTAIGVGGFFIWLIFFKRWQTRTA